MIRRLAAALALAAAVVVAATGPASAHANLVSSDPASGATLAHAPTELRLTFSEPPDPGVSTIQLLNSDGMQVPLGDLTLDGSSTLVAPITGDVPNGVYTVSWSAISTEDGHTTVNAFAFGVGVAPPQGPVGAATGATTSGPTPLGVGGKAALYAGLMLLVAIAVVGMGLFGGAPAARRPIGVWAGLVAALGAIAFLLSQWKATGASLGRYLGAETARTPLALVVVTVVAAILALVAWRSPHRWAPWAAGAAAAIALALRAHGGHAAAAPGPLLAQAEQWVHMLAGACWAGGLLLLVLLVREHRASPPVASARRYSTMALLAIVVVVGSGILRAVAELGGLDDVVQAWSSSYGRTLVIKVAVVIVAVGLGAVNRYRSLRRLPDDAHPLLRIAGTELVAIAGILVLTATLTSFPPPATDVAPNEAASDVVMMTGSDFATTMSGTVTVTPAQPGPNLYRATFTAFGTDQPAAADAVTLQLHSVTRPDLPGASIKLKADGPGWVAQSLAPSIAGTFTLTAQVRSGAAVTEIPLTLITRSTGHLTTIPVPDETAALATFDDGVQIQGTSSPGTPTQIHITAYGADGDELALSGVDVVASPATDPPTKLGVKRFTSGHFAASAILDPGAWTIDAIATSRAGLAYQISWQTTVATPSPSPTP